MNTPLTKPYQPYIATPSKTRVGIFESATSSCAEVIWSQAPATHQETSGISTLLVSDVGNWLSKDPIGISGGLNQYVFVDNGPIMYRDYLGLCGDDDLNSSSYGTAKYIGQRSISETAMGTKMGQESITRVRELTEKTGWEWARWLGVNKAGEYGASAWVTQKGTTSVNPDRFKYFEVFDKDSQWTPAGHIHSHPTEMPPSPGDADKVRWVNRQVLNANPNASDFYVVTPDNVYQVTPGKGYYHLN